MWGYFFFDTLITIGLIATAAPAVLLLWHRKTDAKSFEYRYKRLSLALASALLFGTTILVWGSFIEPNLLIVKEQTIDLPNINTPIRIALMSDFQIGAYNYTAHIERVVEKTMSLHPDLVLLAGDQVDNATLEKDETVYLAPLKILAASYPTYAVHGNHEHGIGGGKGVTDPSYRTGNVTRQTKHALEALGIRYLVNELETVRVNDSSFYLFGGDEYWSENLDFSALDNRSESIPTIMFLHNPAAAWDASKRQIDLLLAGHTHGGQIRLPILGPIGHVDSAEHVPLAWYKGLHMVHTMYLFVTSGTGETGTRARLFNPPEIVLLTIE